MAHIMVPIPTPRNTPIPKKVKDNIDYALAHRNKLKSKINFQTVFKFEYTEEIFTNKNFIEEFINVIY